MKIQILTAFLIATIAVTANSQVPILNKHTHSEGYIHNPTGAIAEEFGEGNLESIELAENGVPLILWGDLNKGITATDPIEKCYQFFEIHKDLLGLIKPRDELVFFRDSGMIKRFYQAHNGVPTDGSYFVHFDESGNIEGITGKIYPEARQINANPKINEGGAISIALSSAKSEYSDEGFSLWQGLTADDGLSNKNKSSGDYRPRLQIKKLEDEFKLTWLVIFYREKTEITYSCLIDAHTGEVIELYDNLRQ